MSQAATPNPPPQPVALFGGQSLIALWNHADLATHLGISRALLAEWRSRGLPHIRMGQRHVLYHEPSVVKWLVDRQISEEVPPAKAAKKAARSAAA